MLPCSWDFPGKNIGLGSYFLLQGIFVTQESNPSLLHWQADSLPRSHQGSPSFSLSCPACPLLVITWLSTAEICVWAPRFKWCWCEERSDFTVKPIIILPWGFLTSAFLIFWTKKTHSFLGCSMYSSTFRSILGLYPVDASNTISFPSCKDQRCIIAKYLPGSKIIPSWELGLWNALLRLKPFLK